MTTHLPAVPITDPASGGKPMPMSTDHQETWLLALKEIAAASRDEILLEDGWDAFATWLRVNPSRIPIDILIPDWDTLTESQRVVIYELYRITDYRTTALWETEAFRKAFELMIGRILMRVSAMADEVKEEGESNDNNGND
jgi:hypothetical protein